MFLDEREKEGRKDFRLVIELIECFLSSYWDISEGWREMFWNPEARKSLALCGLFIVYLEKI